MLLHKLFSSYFVIQLLSIVCLFKCLPATGQTFELHPSSVLPVFNASSFSQEGFPLGSGVPICVSLNVLPAGTNGSSANQQHLQDAKPKACYNMPLKVTVWLVDSRMTPVESTIIAVDSATARPMVAGSGEKYPKLAIHHSFRAGSAAGDTCFNAYTLHTSDDLRAQVNIELLTSTCFSECSDGNSVAGDGCDGNGYVESNFQCLPSPNSGNVEALADFNHTVPLPTFHSCTPCSKGYVRWANETECSPATSCGDILAGDCGAVSGLYDLFLGGDSSTTAVYCDMETPGGPWALVSKFTQKGFGTFTQSDYEAYFRNNLWIKGSAPGIPSNPDIPSSQPNGVAVESLDWRKFLGASGSAHRLRQKVENFDQHKAWDSHWAFTYGGVVSQNEANTDGAKKWDLLDQVVVRNDWLNFQATSNASFWLPFQPGYSGSVYSGCEGWSFDTSGCNAADETNNRRYGAVGIIDKAVGDRSIPWLPFLQKPGYNTDIAFVHGFNVHLAQVSGNNMVGTYWLAEDSDLSRAAQEQCSKHNVNECANPVLNNCHPQGGLCSDTTTSFKCKCKDGWFGDGVSCSPVANCSSLLAFNASTPSGLYKMLGTGAANESTPAVSIYCDMTTPGGPWALVSKFAQTSTRRPATLEVAEYNSYFANGLWINGDSHFPPYDDLMVRETSAPSLSVQSIDWKFILKFAGQKCRLRQTGVNVQQNKRFDVHWDFTYGGVLRQNDATSDSQKKWDVGNRTVVTDTTGITWDTTQETVSFFLPFQAGYSGSIYAGCSGFAFDTTGCDSHVNRRFGNAGIVAPSAGGTDHAFSWMPLTDQNTVHDVVYSHQGGSVMGATSGQPIYGMYWLQF